MLDDAKNVPSFDSSADSSSGFLKFYSETRPTSRFVFESSSKASSIKCLIGSSERSSKSSFLMENIYCYEIVQADEIEDGNFVETKIAEPWPPDLMIIQISGK